MGQIDREHMHEETRQSPFSPPPERFGTTTKIVIFAVVIFLIYKVADWKLSQRAPKPVSTPPASAGPVSPRPESAAPPLPQAPSDSRASESTEGSRTVTKCIVNGKTSYGDTGCAAGAKVTQVVTKENHNLMAAVRVPAPAEKEAPAQSLSVATQNDAGIDRAAMKAECNALEERIKHFDAMARQPQNIPTQDWVREQRKNARDRQARIPCR